MRGGSFRKIGGWFVLTLGCVGLASVAIPPVQAQAPPKPGLTVEERLRRLEDDNQRLAEQNRELMSRYEELMNRHEEVLEKIESQSNSEKSGETDDNGASETPSGQAQGSGPRDPQDNGNGSGSSGQADNGQANGSGTDGGGSEPEDEEEDEEPAFFVDYDDGFTIAPTDEDKTPFLMRINGRMQFRYEGFARSRDFWFDSAGDLRRIRNHNGFEIERGRLSFEGFFLDPALQYYINFDYDTDDEHVVIIQDFWVNYEFGDLINLHVGKAFVPGSREWLSGSTTTQFADRSLATTFFRPDRSIGIWSIGQFTDTFHYRAMLANGFDTADLTFEDIDTNFAYSASTWWEPLGDFGSGYSDLEWHRSPVIRLGNSLTYAAHDTPGPFFQPLAEQNFVRLSDGTRLTQEGALAPDVTVNRFDIALYAIDAAWKYRGWSLNGEYYLRWLQDIRGTGPLPVSTLFDHGFYVAAGYFLVPQHLEVIARTSQIWGEFGSAAEYAGGFTWFINGTHNLKFTFDVSRLIGTPAENSGPNYRAGDTGTMFRGQLQAAF